MTTKAVVATLQREFDEGFARPPRPAAHGVIALLAIRVGARPYALRVPDLGGTAADTRIVPVPSPRAALLGLSGFRGMVVPVFDLAVLLHEARPSVSPRWLALSSGHDPLGFAFSELEGHMQLADGDLHPTAHADTPWIAEVIRTESGLRPVIKLSVLVELLRQRGSFER